MHPKLFSVIFEVRTLIFGTQPLHPYVDRRFSFLLDRRNLIIEPPVGQSHSHSAPNRPAFNVGQSPLEGSVRVLVDWNMVSNASIWCLVASRLGLGWVETPSLWRFWHRQPTANFYHFPNIMLGLLKRPQLFSLIFEVRRLIFGTGPLYPYVVVRFNFQKDLKTLHFDRFFMDHPLQFSRYNDGTADATRVVLAHFWSEDADIWHGWSLSICGPWN